jgi:competence protein ComEC
MKWQEKMMSRLAVTLSLAAVLGILFAESLPAWRGFGIVLVVASLLFFVLAWRKASPMWLLPCTALIFALFHHLQLQESPQHPLQDWLRSRPAGTFVTTEGRIEQALRLDLPGSETGEALYIAESIAAPYLGIAWQGRSALALHGLPEQSLPPGRYRLTGKIHLPYPADNPGQFDEQVQARRLALAASMKVTAWECLHEDSWNVSSFLMETSERCRVWVTQTLSLDLEDSPDARTIILAMALGTTDTASRELQQPFRLSGTLHIFAVSGLHVVIVGLVFWMLLKPLGAPRGIMLVMLIAVLFGYAFITGLRPSAVRAALMASIFFCGALLNRKAHLLSSLGIAALILLGLDTNQLFAPGFQLSFAVLAAITLLNPGFAKPFQKHIEPDPFLPKPLLSDWQRHFWSWKRQTLGLFTVSAAAWVGSLPLMWSHFHLVTPISLAANVALVPLSFAVLFTAILTLVCGGLHLAFPQLLLSNANLFLAKLTMVTAQFFADIPNGNFYLPHELPFQRPPQEVTVLRLPEGGAANHLRIGSQHWLLDTGSAEHFNFIVQRSLQYDGMNQMKGVIMSHSDFEHVGGLPVLAKDLRIPALYQAACEPWKGTGKASMRQLSTLGLTGLPLQAGDTLDLVNAEVLYPLSEVSSRQADDRALVLRLDLGGFRVLWCNDAGFVAEKTMLETVAPESLQCDVIIRNQHASDFSLLPEFLRAVAPRLVISSNSGFPPEQKMSSKLRQDCEDLGIQLYDQAQTGAVTLRFWPERLEVRRFRGETEPLVLLKRDEKR